MLCSINASSLSSATFSRMYNQGLRQVLLEAGEISKEDYDKWRYHYPEFDNSQTYVKIPPQDLF